MSTVFSEVYGTYYNVVAKVLTQALEGKLSAAGMQQLVREGCMPAADSFPSSACVSTFATTL